MFKEAIELLKQANELDSNGKTKSASKIERQALQMLKAAQAIERNPLLDKFQKIIEQVYTIKDGTERSNVLQSMQQMLSMAANINKRQSKYEEVATPETSQSDAVQQQGKSGRQPMVPRSDEVQAKGRAGRQPVKPPFTPAPDVQLG